MATWGVYVWRLLLAVGIEHKGFWKFYYKCGGTILTETMVLTAAERFAELATDDDIKRSYFKEVGFLVKELLLVNQLIGWTVIIFTLKLNLDEILMKYQVTKKIFYSAWEWLFKIILK